MSELENVLKFNDEIQSKVNEIVAKKKPTDPEVVNQRLDDLADEYDAKYF